MSYLRLCGLIAILSVVSATAAFANTASWLSTSSGDWTNPASWTSNPTYPNNSGSATFDVSIATPGSYTVSLGNSVAISSLTLDNGSGTLTQTAGTLSIAGAFNLLSGTYQIGSNARLINSGTMQVKSLLLSNGGTLSGTGSINIAAGASYKLSANAFEEISTTLNNAGTMTLAGDAVLNVDGGTLNNSGTIVATSWAGFIQAYSSLPTSVLNSGTFILNHTGSYNGSISIGSHYTANGGTFLINGGTASLGYGSTYNGACYIGGTGTIDPGGGYTNNGTITLAAKEVNVDEMTDQINGYVNSLCDFYLNNGTLTGTGTLTVASTARMIVASPNVYYTCGLSCNVVNNGSLTCTSGTPLIITGSTLINNSSFTILRDSTSPASPIQTNSGASLVNNGTMAVIGGGTLSLAGVSLSNTGTFAINGGGTVILPSDTLAQFSTSELKGGTWVIGDGTLAIANNRGIIRNDARIYLDTANSHFNSLSSLAYNTGEIGLLGGNVLTFGSAITNTGTFIVNDSQSKLTFNNTLTNSGTITGTAYVNNFVTLSGASSTGLLTGSGSIYFANSNATSTAIRVPLLFAGSNATLNIAQYGQTNGTSVVQSLDLSAGNSRLNLNDHDLIVDYTGASPLTTLTAYLKSGYGSGSWTGPGIDSATAVKAKRTLGIAEASQVLGASGGTFSDQTVDGTSILIRYTYAGDANLDGKVDVADLGLLASHWQQSGGWYQGDFNYDGKIDVVDLGQLAGNWQLGTTGSQMTFAQAMQAVTFVPEPATMLLGVLPITLATGRTAQRRRRSSRTSANALRASGRSAA